ncbi:MAG TPA: hypothetical protein P5205_11410 [Candidatus Paceibacterota bacterium]|nr:hypothetical protein [Verrucomicrobiota bacterium]HSA10965.1 hypothetical protein [Candidatus Paceibacterota bacterium]
MSDKKKAKYDMNSPEAKALTDEIVHGTFMKEGMMAAFPTCFPGASIPIPADESHITALDASGDGMIYGGTSGRATHLFVGMFHGVTGIVFDLGMPAGADHCAAVCCARSKVVSCVNGPDGGRIVATSYQGLPFDLIQEWGFGRPSIDDWGKMNGERIVHAVADSARTSVVGITTHSLFAADAEKGKTAVIGEVPGKGRVALGSKGGIFGKDTGNFLWRYDSGVRKLERQAVKLPAGAWESAPLTWARDARNGLLYTADGEGNLFSLDEQHGFSAPLGRTLLAPVGPMAVTFDGRVFGFCGPEMAKMFCYNPATRSVSNLGVAVSILERRRYGYVFGDAVTGRDGQIFFGEDDDLGHLWLYFPRIQALS